MALLIFASHLASLLLAIYSLRAGGVGVQVLLYAFVIDYLLRLTSIIALHAGMRSSQPGWLGMIAPLVSRRPRAHQTSNPMRMGDGGPPARFSVYLAVLIFLGYLAFVLANVGPDRRLHLARADALYDLSWAIVIGALYWVNGLLTRSSVIDPQLPLSQNLGYNTREVTVLALSVLTAAAIVVYRQNADLPASPWTVMGPLLGWRFIYDVSTDLNALPRAASTAIS